MCNKPILLLLRLPFPYVGRRRAGLTQPIATPALPVASSSTSVVPEYPLQGEASSSRFARRQLLAASFAPIPDHLLGLCRQLSTGSLTPEQRARRAWLAGQWAKAVLDGQVDRPDPTETLDLSLSVLLCVTGRRAHCASRLWFFVCLQASRRPSPRPLCHARFPFDF